MKTAVSTLPQYDHLKRWLAWLHIVPERVTEARQAWLQNQVQQAADPLLSQAHAVIQQGQEAVTAAMHGDPHLANYLIDLFNDHRPSKKAIQYQTKSLASELLEQATKQEPVMVMPYFQGDYPEWEERHSCKLHWIASGEGSTVTAVTPVRFSLWRKITTKSGDVLHCPTCLHGRRMELCELIEKVASYYVHKDKDNDEDKDKSKDGLRYLIIPTNEYKKLSARIRKHNERQRKSNEEMGKLLKEAKLRESEHKKPGLSRLKGNPLEAKLQEYKQSPEYKELELKISGLGKKIKRHVTYTSFPLPAGKTAVLHDAPDWLGGEALPADRAQLYELISQWTDHTPKGKRAGRGLKSWGLIVPDKAQEAADEDTAENGPKPKPGQTKEKPAKWRIIGKGYGRIAMLLEATQDLKANNKRIDLNLPVNDFLDLLDRRGIDYALEGDVPDVTLSAYKQDSICTKRDISVYQGEAEPPKETSQAELDLIFGGQT